MNWNSETSNGVSSRVNGKIFCIVSWLVMKSGYTTITLSVEDHGISPAMHQHGRRSRISMCSKLLLCIWWDQLGVVNYELHKLKPLREITIIDYNWCVWVEHWRKNGRYTSRDTTKWFCNMTRLGHMLHNRWKPTWKRLNGKLPQQPYSPDIALSDYHFFRSMAHRPGWAAFLFLWRCQKMSRLLSSLKRRVVFPTWNSTAARKMEKSG